jgi:EAL domain-containing protein (putative c-di-GMP-specific phosphodiesterase class I)
VLRTACQQRRAWHDAQLPALRLAINVPARQFSTAGLERRLRAVLRETAMEPHWLELELTEGLLMQAGEGTAALLGQLSGLGIRFALGDFGAAGSSLSYLKRFPISRLKIGRSFVQDVGLGAGDAGLARAVIAMAHCLGVDVVAEGVESAEQLEMLRHYGCDEGQGYFLGRPVAAAEVPALLRRPGWPQLRATAASA